jgi:SAM-dependent methyltransferase
VATEVLEPADPSVIRDVSPHDVMYQTDPVYYFRHGDSALHCIRTALTAVERRGVERILDLPSGHGRVLRTLRAAFPDARITACDISTDAVDFCAGTFGAVPVYSNADPGRIELEGDFDLIWCGSLLTHVDAQLWDGFLDLFESRLAPEGVLVFTTHGRRIAHLLRVGAKEFPGLGPQRSERMLELFDRSGFGYQERMDGTGYGISLASPSWVCARLETKPSWRVVLYQEMGWSHTQDVVACYRKPVDRVLKR